MKIFLNEKLILEPKYFETKEQFSRSTESLKNLSEWNTEWTTFLWDPEEKITKQNTKDGIKNKSMIPNLDSYNPKENKNTDTHKSLYQRDYSKLFNEKGLTPPSKILTISTDNGHIKFSQQEIFGLIKELENEGIDCLLTKDGYQMFKKKIYASYDIETRLKYNNIKS